ncbi:tryptophan/threonine-rich antigen, putative [Plasmodium ovale curtisi]|uniref:Tryptophan/threonine-rich antigen, putative n=1 Tax=Plasmodium ovale curtisi TaxID=864141 RepID=A0A1A8WPP3_PLAOA|nr:tryptophan/threonine-rich antigen, putative [Plasmodium ovale curtisi]SBT01783.1 tryptophan/threonine-rich antigen, putative [Plasmodium ovale curtisi]
MEADINMENSITETTANPDSSENVEESVSSKVHSKYITPVLSAFLLFWSSVTVLLNSFYPVPLTEGNDNGNDSAYLVGPDEGLEKDEELKSYAWGNWMIILEEDWIELNLRMENQKNKWLESREEEWKEWIKKVENKWMHYEGNMKKELTSDIQDNVLIWNDAQWEEWVKTEGKHLMEVEWENWINESESSLNELIVKEWTEWKNNKIMEWQTSEWKLEEDEYWAKWEESTFKKLLHATERRKWHEWKERISREWKEWINWVRIKEGVYINVEWNKWSEWKNEKNILFNKWKESFVDKWVTEKQWKVWVKEKIDIISQNCFQLNDAI